MVVDVLPEDAPAPRLCHLIKWPDFDGYGFNLHAERSNPGQFIGKIDEDSPAQLAGLCEGDRIVEVNGVNVNNENHRQVVERIKAEPSEARLLVVDTEADLWYQEQDLVVKSSQLNVVYIKTPVPRPAQFGSVSQQQAPAPAAEANENPAELVEIGAQDKAAKENGNESENEDEEVAGQKLPSASQSLETSDFNDDSLEPARGEEVDVRRASPASLAAVPAKSLTQPPMSPDSGKGDDEDRAIASELVVKAEINQNQAVAEQRARKQQVLAEVKRQFGDKAVKSQTTQASDEETVQDSNNNSKSCEQGAREPSAKSTGRSQHAEDEKEHIRKVHNKSVDSGKSSSPDAASDSGSCRIGESHTDLVEIVAVQAGSGKSASGKQTNETSSLQESNGHENLIKNKKEPQDEQTTKPTISESDHIEYCEAPQQRITTESIQQKQHETEEGHAEISVEEGKSKHRLIESHETSEEDLESSATTDSMTKITTGDQLQSSHKQMQVGGEIANANNNNYSGLNLNMTASQMRELIASRKKFDPKKAQMNIRQKYEIIQQM